jgi:hypothetical protein
VELARFDSFHVRAMPFIIGDGNSAAILIDGPDSVETMIATELGALMSADQFEEKFLLAFLRIMRNTIEASPKGFAREKDGPLFNRHFIAQP